MKKTFMKILGIVLAAAAVLSIICAVTVTGSGFLDLSNIAKAVFFGVAVICGISAIFLWRYSK